jgi:hypothetical protein
LLFGVLFRHRGAAATEPNPNGFFNLLRNKAINHQAEAGATALGKKNQPRVGW